MIEAIVERLDAKVELLAQVDPARGANAIVSSNTSGIPIAALAEGRSHGFKRHWLGTHFFNPPRYLRLLEVIPTADTDPAVVDRVTRFADERLGKGVVIAKDSPNFIGNHLALFEVTRILAAVAAGPYSIEEVDAITGPAIGRPKSATFRTLDLAGLDILAHVIENLRAAPAGTRGRGVRHARIRGADARGGIDRRESRPRLLQARQGRGGRFADSRDRPGDAGVPARRSRPSWRRWQPPSRLPTWAHASPSSSAAAIALARSSGRSWRRRWSMPHASHLTWRTPPTTWIA